MKIVLRMPVSAFVYYDTALRRGEFPPEADSIMIPLTQFGMGWCAGRDLWFAATSIGRHYPLDVVQGLPGAYVFLAVRAALCSPSPTRQAAAPAPAA